MISSELSRQLQVTLDRFMPKPLTAKMEKFMKLCDSYMSMQGKSPDCPYSVDNFIQDNKLPNDVKLFKYLPLRSIAAYYGRWKAMSSASFPIMEVLSDA